MDLADLAERHRLVTFVRATVPAATQSDYEALLRLVDGYPGVIGRWSEDYWRQEMASAEDLAEVASDAWNYRYRELGDLLPALGAETNAALPSASPLCRQPPCRSYGR
jgi:hypothetical protein